MKEFVMLKYLLYEFIRSFLKMEIGVWKGMLWTVDALKYFHHYYKTTRRWLCLTLFRKMSDFFQVSLSKHDLWTMGNGQLAQWSRPL